MEKNEVTLYELAKKQIDKTMRKVISENKELANERNIKEQTAIQLSLRLTDTIETSGSFLSDKVEKAIEYTMQVFDKAFAEVYKRYLQEQQEEKQQSIVAQSAMDKTKQENLGEER